MTYNKIVLSALLLSISSISFCEETIIGYILKKIFTANATLLQSKSAGSAAAAKPNNSSAASVPPAPTAAVAAAPKFDLYEAKRFLKKEADALKNSSICGTWFEPEPSILCYKSQLQEARLRYILKHIARGETSLQKQLEQYIKEEIKNLDENQTDDYLADIRSDLDGWNDLNLLHYQGKNREVRKRLAQAYKNIFGKNI